MNDSRYMNHASKLKSSISDIYIEGVGGPKKNRLKLLTAGDTSKGGLNYVKTGKIHFQSLSYYKFSNLSRYSVSHQSVLDKMHFHFAPFFEMLVPMQNHFCNFWPICQPVYHLRNASIGNWFHEAAAFFKKYGQIVFYNGNKWLCNLSERRL